MLDLLAAFLVVVRRLWNWALWFVLVGVIGAGVFVSEWLWGPDRHNPLWFVLIALGLCAAGFWLHIAWVEGSDD